MHEKQIEIYKKMTPAERFEAASEMYRLAWEIKFKALAKQFPDASKEKIEQLTKESFLYARN